MKYRFAQTRQERYQGKLWPEKQLTNVTARLAHTSQGANSAKLYVA